MIMAHDAATTYLQSGGLHVVNSWAKTQQDGGPSGMLGCGARAFDWRPTLLSNGTIIAHHGDVQVAVTMDTSLSDFTAWLGQHGQAVQDLVVLGITECIDPTNAPGTCVPAVQKLLGLHGVTWVQDCGLLQGLTAAEAYGKSKLPGGGSMLAIFDCWDMNYDDTIACSGYNNATHTTSRLHTRSAWQILPGEGEDSYTCYTDSPTKNFPLNRMWSYADLVVNKGPPSDGSLYAYQGIWQETAASVEIGLAHGSSLLGDETKSDLNNLIAQRISVCDYPG
jgi:hypothetical protein